MLGSKFCISFPFARSGFYFLLKSQNLPKGSEIIMPPITIKPFLDIVISLGLTPVFVDINPNNFCYQIEYLENKLNKNTRAILITYLFGMVPNITPIIGICKRHNLFIIEDISQCLNGKHAGVFTGNFGHAGIYSSSSTKTCDAYGGGHVICNDTKLAHALRNYETNLTSPSRVFLLKKILINSLRNFLTEKAVFTILTYPIICLLKYFQPDAMIKHTGERNLLPIIKLPDTWFQKFSSLQAEVGIRQMKDLKNNDKIRINNVKKFTECLSNINFPIDDYPSKSVYWQLVALFPNQDQKIRNIFHKNRIDTSKSSLTQISNLPAYSIKSHTPNAQLVLENGYFIPSYPNLSETEIKRIINALQQIK